uniref:Uncharacterized protein n=1 Tax=Nelumbo nucifera TaxID=4432 RepID=A0A822XJR0_NELNU|nr:TPA_asm: hypothetical protein HUJ06_023247 [Nelumbo nucifera]
MLPFKSKSHLYENKGVMRKSRNNQSRHLLQNKTKK